MPDRKLMSNEQPGKSQTKLASSGRPAEQAAQAGPDREHTRDVLYQEAARLGINGRSRMTVPQLKEAIAEHEAGER